MIFVRRAVAGQTRLFHHSPAEAPAQFLRGLWAMAPSEIVPTEEGYWTIAVIALCPGKGTMARLWEDRLRVPAVGPVELLGGRTLVVPPGTLLTLCLDPCSAPAPIEGLSPLPEFASISGARGGDRGLGGD